MALHRLGDVLHLDVVKLLDALLCLGAVVRLDADQPLDALHRLLTLQMITRDIVSSTKKCS